MYNPLVESTIIQAKFDSGSDEAGSTGVRRKKSYSTTISEDHEGCAEQPSEGNRSSVWDLSLKGQADTQVEVPSRKLARRDLRLDRGSPTYSCCLKL